MKIITIDKSEKNISFRIDEKSVSPLLLAFAHLESIPQDFLLKGVLKEGGQIMLSSIQNSSENINSFFHKYLENSEVFTLAEGKQHGLVPEKRTFTSKLGKTFTKIVWVDPETHQRVLRQRVSPQEKAVREITHQLEMEAKKQKQVEEVASYGGREVPWHIRGGIKVDEISSEVMRYSKGNISIDVVNLGINFKIYENGIHLGNVPRERDAINYVRRRFDV